MLQFLDHVVMFVSSVRDAVAWYGSVLGLPIAQVDDNFATINIGASQLSFHVADAKVAAGHSGQVAYWRVSSLADSSERMVAGGATLYRGPLAIDSGIGICQFADPFGNLIGLIGAYRGAQLLS